ncbi:MAG: hypothetical protein AAGG01_21525 [Planctomycetota bacterium]
MLKGYRTMILNALASVLPVLELTEWYAVLPDGWVPYYVLALALLNMWMRSITTTPVGQNR